MGQSGQEGSGAGNRPDPGAALDMDLLRTFAMIVDCGSFTRAAERLGRTQSTISLQMKRLEDDLRHPVFDRTARGIHLTAAGEVLLTYARRILDLAGEARARLREPEMEGTVRLGTPEDFATVHLPEALASFSRANPRVRLDVRCDFTLNLLEGFARGEFDLVLVKREPQGPEGGVRVWREPLVWAGSPAFFRPAPDAGPLPLVLAPRPDVYRKRALEALEAAGLTWRIVYTSPSLAGIQAAVRAGLGITVLPREMVPDAFRVLGADAGLPRLEDTEIALYRAPGGLSRAAERLAEHLVRSVDGSPDLPQG
ncbi:MAG TPA: LysR substrate-binding domain-containing protein [Azospirillaceae bacterium]|nr:LysR substrate-binding domain-containing protein [Azospirillaceae bacterium]